MANELSLSNAQIPAHLANRVGKPSALASSIGGGLSSGEAFPRISIKGSRFRIVEDGAEVVLNKVVLDVVIVGANPKLSKLWYAKAWDADAEPTAPDCYSLDGMRPHPEATSPQNDLCSSCPHNAWGSKITPSGAKVKSCGDQKRLAVVSADDPEGTVYLLQVTPAALKGLNGYQKELTARGIAPEIVKTRIGFDTDASFPKLTFGFGGFLSDTEMFAVDKLFGADKVLEITGEKSFVAPIKASVELPKPQLVKEAKPMMQEIHEQHAKEAEGGPVEPVAQPKGKGFKADVADAPKAAAKPKAAPVSEKPAETVPAGNPLADEIASLLAGMGADDAGTDQ